MASIKLVGIHTARLLRRNQTEEEEILWSYLRSRRLNGIKFKRQEPIFYQDEFGKESFFVVDFYCPSKKVIVELDGGIHLGQKEADEKRSGILQSLGNFVLRIKNEELLEIDSVLKLIADTCALR